MGSKYNAGKDKCTLSIRHACVSGAQQLRKLEEFMDYCVFPLSPDVKFIP